MTIFTDFWTSRWFITDVNSVLGLLRRVAVCDAAVFPEGHAASMVGACPSETLATSPTTTRRNNQRTELTSYNFTQSHFSETSEM
jgi:hypothetical protein